MSDHLDKLEAHAADGSGGPKQYPDFSAFYADLRNLCAECRRLRDDVAALEGLFADLQSDDAGGRFAAGVAHGAARQLAECVNAACLGCREGWRWEDLGWAAYHVTPQAGRQECLSYKLLRLGPVRAPLPMERLAADNARLREALAGLLGAFRVEGDGRMVIHNGFGLPARVAAARAALGGGP